MWDEVRQIAQQHPARAGKKTKRPFQKDVVAYFERLGYDAKVSRDRAVVMNENIVAGDVSRAKYIFTAHYDTPPRMLLPANIIFPQKPFLTFFLQTVIMLAMFAAVGLLWSAIARMLGVSPFWRMELGWILCSVVFMLLFFSFPNKVNANDNTSGVCGVMEAAARMPGALREQVAFILFDHEEMGLLGSAAFFLKHTEDVKRKVLVNLDCIGVGEDIWFIADKKFSKKPGVLEQLKACIVPADGKRVEVRGGKGYFFPSDQLNFNNTVVVAALKRKGNLFYLDQVHTSRDTVLDERNVDVIVEALVNIAGSGIAQA